MHLFIHLILQSDYKGIVKNGVNITVKDLLRQDARIQDLYFNISEVKPSITSLFSVQIMPYLEE